MEKISTGIKGFDDIMGGLYPGDNVVWQVEDINNYRHVANAFAKKSVADGKKVNYIRFGKGNPVIDDLDSVNLFELDLEKGFEEFTMSVHRIIKTQSENAVYVFDSLTYIQRGWYSDLMTVNFFKVTCPYLYKMGAVAYFSIKRNSYTYETIAKIRETTQVLMDIYNVEGSFYIHPLKVEDRYTPILFFPHKIDGDEVTTITSSGEASKLFSNFDWRNKRLGYWRINFNKAKSALTQDEVTQNKMKEVLINILVGKDSKIHDMCQKYFTLADMVQIASREIGTGFIGGKSIGMLMANAIISKSEETKEYFKDILEPHDSFYIGTDVFYSYIVENGLWDLRMKQKTDEGYFVYAQELQDGLKNGKFSQMIEEQFMHLLEYYGQCPIIVRSSSLLEDNFGNAFAGKYDSVFCINQGTPEARLKDFEDAIRTVYASTMNEDALNYRKNRGLDKRDEQMAILVQRVSGDYYGEYYFPHVAGVANSSNLYVWNKKIDMDAGMLRLVFGLGTRAVDRVNNDYVRIVALDDPTRLPAMTKKDPQKFCQHYVDVLNLNTNSVETVTVNDAVKNNLKTQSNLFGTKDKETEERFKRVGIDTSNIPFVLNFERLLRSTKFAEAMRKILKVVSSKYNYPVDIEYTANFDRQGNFRINIVQCRPLQTRGLGKTVELPKLEDSSSCLFSSQGNFMGGNVRLAIDYIVFVSSDDYLKLSEVEKYDIARQIGFINKELKGKNAMLMGPGRWGSSNPALGVPVKFTELCNMSVMCEIAYSNQDLMPELSYGSHFFQDLVETGIFYVALFDNKSDVIFNEYKLREKENIVKQIIKDNNINEDVIKVYDTKGLQIYSDITEQIVTCS
ncbi:MAG: PEP/pyruvate-binding domain-containing protein [Intestinibacter sp.]|uniref:PEP/pyruvate-binding domain-containing protein n=1 Tax=Intestinibacter sp. TaxID=1965304 RepID=UPI0025C0AE2E|nr:PEP/pyruvate-binding domain-containing protein [Intestinibacter sp.]MCI6736999.1 PEP/pyruvate-binding domain-containing protein [Intestinibacter sp.]